jgi:hypothetical protein
LYEASVLVGGVAEVLGHGSFNDSRIGVLAVRRARRKE